MAFDQKYPILQVLLSARSKRRSGRLLDTVRFIVAHDTGNEGSTARNNVMYYERTHNEKSASAHIFVDDKEIIECVPALTGTPEKAWHVLYGVDKDNLIFGDDANDSAIGVEYCYGPKIDATEAYRRYVWVLAFLCYEFKIDPSSKIIGHCFLDPKRKTDPVTGLARSRRTYDQLLEDVVQEYLECQNLPVPNVSTSSTGQQKGRVKVRAKLNIRKGAPRMSAQVIRTALPGEFLSYVSASNSGQKINGNSLWYEDKDGNFFWSGGTITEEK